MTHQHSKEILDFFKKLKIDPNNLPVDLPEAKIHSIVCSYLRLKYPDVVFTTDASGLKLDMAKAAKFAKLKSQTGIPDLIILEPRKGFHSLLLEIKKDNVELHLKTKLGYYNCHFKDQGDLLARLADKGFLARFSVGLKESLNIIDGYLENK